MEPVLEPISSTVDEAVRAPDPQDACEVIEDGMLPAGGGAWLPGLEQRPARATRLEMRRAPEPAHAVIRGASLLPGSPRLDAVMGSDLFPSPIPR